MNSLSHPVVVILGAGATRGAFADKSSPPPPVDTDFFDIAGQLSGHGTREIASRVLKSVWQLYGRTSGISLERYYRDIETRAAILKFAKTANQPKDWARRQTDLEELVRRVYIHTTCDTLKEHITPRTSEDHAKILNILRDGDTVVTFNYDLVIEEAFSSGARWTPANGYGSSVQGKSFSWCRRWLERVQPRESRNPLLLLKLHGSLNWTLYRDGTIRLKPFPYVVRTKNKRPAFDKVSILPPGWNKRIDKKPYRNFWREARLRLEKCRTLIIIGYSLPETDLLAQALFSEVVRLRQARAKHIKNLHLADPNQVVREKLTNLFTPALGPTGLIFKYSDIREFTKSIPLAD